MKVTKFAHACLLVEENGTKILLDPGSWNPLPQVENLDVLLVTHEHQDHFDIAQVKEILEKNTECQVFTHEAVGKLLTEANITHTIIAEGEEITVKGVSIESVGHEHSVVYGASPCQNSGFFIAKKLLVPGDALHDVPNEQVEVLALPIGGPWMKISEAIDYAKRVKPKTVFPIHDAMYIESYARELVPRVAGGHLESAGIEFRDMSPGSTEEF